MRYPIEVITQIVKIIPKDHEYYPSFNSVRESVLYHAPEIEQFSWSLITEHVNHKIDPPPFKNKLDVKIVSILMNKSEEDIIKEFGYDEC